MKKNNLLLNIYTFLYFLFAILSIHTINNIYFYLMSIALGVLFIFKKYLKLSSSILAITLLLTPTWLFFNGLFYGKILHYTLLSDVLTAFILPIIFSLINYNKAFKFNLLYLLFSIIAITFSPYYASENLVYWVSLLVVIFSSLNVIKKEYAKDYNYKKKLILFFLFFITIFYYLVDTYIPITSNKIAVLKSDWCNVSNIPDSENYQIGYYYAYSDFMKILESYGKTTIIENQDLDNNELKYDIIVLLTPTKPLSNLQVKNLNNFVKRGGRLVLITDHTNLYGHLDCILSLLKSFNIKMNDDAVFNPKNYYEKAFLNINSINFNNIIMKTGNSIIPSITSKIWAITPKIISEKADYTNDNFFGELLYTSDDAVGNFPVGITTKKGLGSFVIWNDSTIFSNFSITQKDNIKLLDYIIKNRIFNNIDRKMDYYFIRIFAFNNNVFWEAPPNYKPDSKHFSTLIANFTRKGLFPDFAKKLTKDTIFFTTYDYFCKNINKIISSKIVIIDDIPSNNILNAKKYSFEDYKITNNDSNFYYSQDGRYISTKYKDKSIIFAKNVLSDNELGTWWNATPISPYKKEMIIQFLNWAKNGKEILIYKYPDLKCIKQGYIVKYSNSTQEYWDKLYLSKIINSDKNNIVYIGNRQWAFVVDKNTYFGTPEMSDNYTNTLNLKWTAKIVNETPLIKEIKKAGCPINRFEIGTKNVAP